MCLDACLDTFEDMCLDMPERLLQILLGDIALERDHALAALCLKKSSVGPEY